MKKIRVGGRVIGDGEPCFIIAEAGSNHNGEFEQARRLIEVAAHAGADAVKFQVFRASRLYPRSAGVSDYLKVNRSIYDIIAEMEMPYDWLPELAKVCRDQGILFMASVFDEESADRVDPYVEVFKIASYEMTHIPLLRYVASKGKPVIMSTGTAELQEVAASAAEFEATGNSALALMQCTASYPAPIASLNVRAIVTMKTTFDCPVGLSDHSRDPLVGPLTAIGVGANLLEKHFTLSNELPGPDHRFAVEPTELRVMVDHVRNAEQALGSGAKLMDPIEAELRAFARRSVFAVRDIEPGELLTPENIAVLRCGAQRGGFAPRDFTSLLGRKAARCIAAETAVTADDIA